MFRVLSAMEGLRWWTRLGVWAGLRQPPVQPSGKVLLAAAERGDARMVRAQLAAGVLPDEPRNATFQTALCLAAHFGHTDVVRALLAAGADPVVEGTGSTPLFRAAFRGHHEIIALMAAARPDVFHTRSAAVALRRAALSGHSLSVRAILQGGAPATAPAPDYPNAMFAAATCDSASLAELLQAGADPHQLDQQGRTALHHAATAGDVECVTLLLAYGADPRARDFCGRTPVDEAGSQHLRDLLEALPPADEPPRAQ